MTTPTPEQIKQIVEEMRGHAERLRKAGEELTANATAYWADRLDPPTMSVEEAAKRLRQFTEPQTNRLWEGEADITAIRTLLAHYEATRAAAKCGCREPWTLGIVHQENAPCYHPEATRAKAEEKPATFGHGGDNNAKTEAGECPYCGPVTQCRAHVNNAPARRELLTEVTAEEKAEFEAMVWYARKYGPRRLVAFWEALAARCKVVEP